MLSGKTDFNRINISFEKILRNMVYLHIFENIFLAKIIILSSIHYNTALNSTETDSSLFKPAHTSIYSRIKLLIREDLRSSLKNVFEETMKQREELRRNSAQNKLRTKRSSGSVFRPTRRWYAPSIFQSLIRNRCYASVAPCPSWTDWDGQNTCSVSCGGGQRVLLRHCKNRRSTWSCEGPNTMVERCNTQLCPAWGEWFPSTECTGPCTSGQLVLSRRCMLGADVVKGCSGPSNNVTLCSSAEHCAPKWTKWSEFGPCVARCEESGVQERSRTCLHKNTKLGRDCYGSPRQSQTCLSEIRCPPKYSPWNPWESCNISCGKWSHSERRRSCLESSCKEESLVEIKPCHGKRCSLNITIDNSILSRNIEATLSDKLGTWSEWSSCTTSCGEAGIQLRARNCSVVEDSDFTHPVCNEKYTEARICSHHSSCPHWSVWLVWGGCEGNCSSTGKRSRRRSCVINKYSRTVVKGGANKNQNDTITGEAISSKLPTTWLGATRSSHDFFTESERTTPGGRRFSDILFLPTRGKSQVLSQETVDVDMCPEEYPSFMEEISCKTRPCQAHWLEWSTWSSCSSTCGTGYAISTRSCSKRNRRRCPSGETIRYERCYSPPCWSSWSAYSPCTTSCGSDGVKSRTRQCNGAVHAIQELSQCKGNSTERTSCNTHVCPRWGQWSEYTECSKSCGHGRRFKSRKCEMGSCEGRVQIQEGCNLRSCPSWSKWTLFSCCSASCGEGVKTRTRTCRGGLSGDCPGRAEHVVRCNSDSCNVTQYTMASFECGIKESASSAVNTAVRKIFGGKISQAHAWPWQVSLQHTACHQLEPCWRHYCGGTLVHPQFVVTAAHCSETHPFGAFLQYDDPSSAWTVVVGTSNLNYSRRSNRIGMKRVIIHRDYYARQALYNDIQLIKLKRPVQLSASVAPACLPGRNRFSQENTCYITGWGYTESQDSTTIQLREAQIPILSFEQCQTLGYRFLFDLRSRNHMCAGDPITAFSDSCEGDSGGPLACQGSDTKWYLTGITSFGFKECGTRNTAGIYTPLIEYQSWVTRMIEEFSHPGC